jgi:hypothetical protein
MEHAGKKNEQLLFLEIMIRGLHPATLCFAP